MSLDDFLFSNRKTLSSDRSVEEIVANLDDAGVDLEIRYVQLRRKHERLELMVESIIAYLEHQGGLDRDVLRVMMQRLDLADGVEDGRMGPDQTARAPKCISCGYPLNPKRDDCLYCGAEKKTAPPRAGRKAPCHTCGRPTLESAAFITMEGLVCPDCFEAKETGAGAGRLSVADGASGALSNVDGESGTLSDPTERG